MPPTMLLNASLIPPLEQSKFNHHRHSHLLSTSGANRPILAFPIDYSRIPVAKKPSLLISTDHYLVILRVVTCVFGVIIVD